MVFCWRYPALTKYMLFFYLVVIFLDLIAFELLVYDALFPSSLCRTRMSISQYSLASNTKQVYIQDQIPNTIVRVAQGVLSAEYDNGLQLGLRPWSRSKIFARCPSDPIVGFLAYSATSIGQPCSKKNTLEQERASLTQLVISVSSETTFWNQRENGRQGGNTAVPPYIVITDRYQTTLQKQSSSASLLLIDGSAARYRGTAEQANV